MAPACTDFPGLMQQASVWCYLLVKALPKEDRLALFQTCMQLARTVVRVTRNMTSNLRTEVPANVLDVRRDAITRLLDEGQMFAVNVNASGPQPFPQALSHKVNSLWLECDEPCATTSFHWQALHNLQELTWYGAITAHEVTDLCKAVEQGQLAKLTRIEFCPIATGEPTLYKRLAASLGRQVSDLTTSHAMLLRQLSHFNNVAAVQVHTFSLSEEEVPGILSTMCRLPRLRAYHFQARTAFCGSAKAEGIHDNLDKRGIFDAACPHRHLASLPVTDLQTIEFRGATPNCDGTCLTDLLTHHGHKIICTPDKQSEFWIHHFDAQHLQLLSRLQGKAALNLGYSPQLELLQMVWAAVPAHVEVIRMNIKRGSGWELLWLGLPVTVTSLELEASSMTVGQWQQLVASTPKHVSLLNVIICRDHMQQMQALNLQQYAPPHLAVILKMHRWAQ